MQLILSAVFPRYFFSKTILILGHAWVGLNDIDQEGMFVWTDGSPNTYTRFDANQPDNRAGNEHCVLMKYQDGNFMDRPCTRNQPFICEVNYESL